jgi:hypothetical protein
MLGRDIESHELHAENAERLVQCVLTRFSYTAAEIAVMESVICARKSRAANAQPQKPGDSEASGGFLLGCLILFGSIALCIGAFSFIGCLMRKSVAGNIIGLALLPGVLGFLVILCRVFRGKKGRPP